MIRWIALSHRLSVGFRPMTGANLKITAYFKASAKENLSLETTFGDICRSFDHQMITPNSFQWSVDLKESLRQTCPQLAWIKIERGDGFSWEV